MTFLFSIKIVDLKKYSDFMERVKRNITPEAQDSRPSKKSQQNLFLAFNKITAK